MTAPKTKPIPLAALIEQLQVLAALEGTERARVAKASGNLGAIARASVAAAGDEGIWQARQQGMSHKDIMAAMDYKDRGPVVRALDRHKKRRTGEL